jgi:hypothetical protein
MLYIQFDMQRHFCNKLCYVKKEVSFPSSITGGTTILYEVCFYPTVPSVSWFSCVIAISRSVSV